VKKKLVATTITISMLMLSAIAGKQFPNYGVANPYEAYTYTAPPIIEIHSPLDNETVYSKNVPLNLTVTKPDGWGWLLCLSMAGQLYSNKLTVLTLQWMEMTMSQLKLIVSYLPHLAILRI
jgi:hypothetical protein